MGNASSGPTPPDFIELQAVGVDLCQRVDVDLVVQTADLAAQSLGRVLDQVADIAPQRRLRHPDQVRRDSRRHRRHLIRRDEHVAAPQVDVVGRGEDHGLRRNRFRQAAVIEQNFFDGGSLARR